MITRQKADRAINQLLSCVLGRVKAKASSHLEHNSIERIEFCSKMIQKELQDLLENKNSEDLGRSLNGGRMQLDSLQSLKTLARLIDEVDDWDS